MCAGGPQRPPPVPADPSRRLSSTRTRATVLRFRENCPRSGSDPTRQVFVLTLPYASHARRRDPHRRRAASSSRRAPCELPAQRSGSRRPHGRGRRAPPLRPPGRALDVRLLHGAAAPVRGGSLPAHRRRSRFPRAPGHPRDAGGRAAAPERRREARPPPHGAEPGRAPPARDPQDEARDRRAPGPAVRPARWDLGLPWVAARPRPAVVEPLAPSRYKVQFTASAELREKLERLEARRFGRTKSARKTVSTCDSAPRTRRIPAAVRRAVDERDEGRCRCVDAQGHRCTASARLEFHHRRPWAFGGDHSPDNLALLCSAHNRLMAEIDYGRSALEKHRHSTAAARVAQPRSRTG